MKLKDIFLILLTLASFSVIANAENLFVGVECGYFIPLDGDFNDIYGGNIIFGANAGYMLSDDIGIITAAGFYSADGISAVTQQNVSISLLNGRVGVFYVFNIGDIKPRIGAGLALVNLEEKTPWGNTSELVAGWYASGGVFMPVSTNLTIGAEVIYSDASIEGAFGDQRAGGFSVLANVGFYI